MTGAVVGIDLSLTGTGLTVIDGEDIHTWLIKTTGKKNASLNDIHRRFTHIEDELLVKVDPVRVDPSTSTGGFGYSTHVDLVVIEAPSYGSQGGGQHERAGLWWSIVRKFLRWDVPVGKVAPTTLKKYITGSGRADKDVVLAEAIKRYPQASITNNNVADSVGLAAMGARYLGRPVEASLAARNIEAIGAATWPT